MEVELVKDVAMFGDRCPRCGKGPMVTDNSSGEMFCGNCGFVVTERIEETGPEWRAFSKEEHEDRSRAGIPTSLAMHDMGLATIIGPVDKDASGKPLSASMKSTIERLRTWDSRSQVHEPVDRNFRQAFSELDRLKDKMAVVDPVKCVARIASKAGLSERTKRKALEILKKAEEGKISAGKDPMGLAAAALYVACVMNGENKTQKDVAEAAGVTEVTIRNRYKGLKTHLRL